jgi:hypothetical protein
MVNDIKNLNNNICSKISPFLQNKLDVALYHHKNGRLQLAQKLYKELCNIFPYHPNILVLSATLENQLNQPENALNLLDKAITLEPLASDIHNLRGVILKNLNRLSEARESFDKALLLNPDNFDAHNNLGFLLRVQKNYPQAVLAYKNAITLKSDYIPAILNLGFLYEEIEALDFAQEQYQRCLELDPNLYQAYLNLGNISQKLKSYSAALKYYDQSINLNSEVYQAWANRGLVLKELDRLEEALESFKKADYLFPNSAEILNSLGSTLKLMGMLSESLKYLEVGLKISPNNSKIHSNLSLLYLLQGDFKRGFAEYEWRWKDEEISAISGKREFPQPLWLGDRPLEGKTILIYCEQGLGDTIQFSRYVPLLHHLGCHVILEVQAPLIPLFKNIPGIQQLIPFGQPLPEFDYQCPIMSLPLAFGTTLETIPPTQPIHLETTKIAEWESRLGPQKKPRIGLVWSGSTTHKDDRRRSIVLKDYLEHCIPDFEYISLQKEVRKQDQGILAQSDIRHFEDHLQDFSDTAALISLLDLVVTVDTSVAHLSASLNKPTLILIPYSPDWRWMLDRDNSPWYPSVKLFRQPALGDWKSTIQSLFDDILSIKSLLLKQLSS